MKALFVSNPGIGHVNPMFPVAHALVQAGHSVAFAVAPLICPHVTRQGFETIPAGLDWFEPEIERAFPEFGTLGLEQQAMFLLRDLFADMAAHRMAADLLTIARDWRADLIVRNDYEFGSCVVAERLRLPHATISICFFMPEARLRLAIGDQLSYLRSAFGLAPYPAAAMTVSPLYLTYAPADLEPRVLPQMAGIQPAAAAFRPSGELPARLAAFGDRPLIYVSLGTVFNRTAGVMAAVLDGLREEPVAVLATVGSTQNPAAFDVPPHVIVEQYVPQEIVLPRAALFVTHAPFYTAMTGLRFGIPLLMVPQGGDQASIALRLARLGVGLILRHREHDNAELRQAGVELTPESVRRAVRQLLADRESRAARERLRDRILEMPGPDDAVGRLERLVARGRSSCTAPI